MPGLKGKAVEKLGVLGGKQTAKKVKDGSEKKAAVLSDNRLLRYY
jgi:hypothetical protein